MTVADRIEAARRSLEAIDAEGLLITNLANVFYLTGFSGTNGQLLLTADDAIFLSDTRYEARAHSLVRGARILIYPTRLTELLPNLIADSKISSLAIESQTMTIAERDDISGALGSVRLVATKGIIEDLRRAKDADELAAIQTAVDVADEAFEWVLDRLVPGAIERDIALRLEVRMREQGADGISFDPIVGSGELSAHVHHSPGERPLEKGDLVLMDFGCKVAGYCSDVTRTVVLGTPTDEQAGLYEIVLAAQGAGIAAAVEGAPCREVDGAARGVIEAAGHGARFGHGLGHGVGIDIHEAPRCNRVSDESLRRGDVVTVEPGIYVPGAGGIRIEDCVVVEPAGARVLGSAPKDRLISV